MVRKFKKVAKTKGGVPKKYVKGAKNPKARELSRRPKRSFAGALIFFGGDMRPFSTRFFV